MRSKISDQELTDYALDELGPDERLYVESMLAVSEECRNDVYETIDLAMSLEEGFEREEGKTELAGLTAEQRMALLNVRVPNRFWHRSAAALAAAAAIALAFVSKEVWMPKGSALRVARATHTMTTGVTEAVNAAEGEDFVNQLSSFLKFTGNAGKWLPAQAPGGAAVFGPPASFNVEAPHSGLEFSE